MVYSTFPRIPHLAGSHADDDDLVLSVAETKAFLAQPLWAFEKRDGLNVMLARNGRGRVAASLKPDWQGVADGAVERAIGIWVAQREESLWQALKDGTAVYGEWLWHTVSISYTALDDLFVVMGVRNPKGRLLAYLEGAAWSAAHGLTSVHPLRGAAKAVPMTSTSVRRLVGRSQFGATAMEGIILDNDDADDTLRFAKWVDARYVHPTKGVLSGARNTLR